jgi:hypothetical protein
VSSRLFWRAAAIQTVLTGGLFLILLVTVPHHFFDDWGFVVGPVIWVGCCLAAGRLLGMPVLFTLFCAAAGAVAGTLVGLVVGHAVGIVAGIAVFAASASGYGAPGSHERPRDESRAPDVARS